MKVDIVVNSMIQQIDRNLQTQLMPAASFRPGEILQGRVMLTADERLQIRLDSGALLNAMPAGGVLLQQGATVTLRVSGHMDGDLIMQLLGQELDGRVISGQGVPAAEAQAAPVLPDTPQGREILQSMQRLGVPIREETAKQALEILQRFPGLEPDKAVFMAANRMNGTQAQVDALNRITDQHATTGSELMKLADILLSQAHDPAISEDIAKGSAQRAAAPLINTTDVQVATLPLPGDASAEYTQMSAAMAASAPQDPGMEPPTAMVAQAPVLPSSNAPATAAGLVQSSPLPEAARQDGMLRLQSLAMVALGEDAAERYSGVIAKLADTGSGLSAAAALALDGPFMDAEQLAQGLQALEDALPKDIAKDARVFVEALTRGVAQYAAQNYMPAISAPAGDTGVVRVVRQIMDMFVRVDESDESQTETTLAKAAGAQREGLARIAADITRAGAASPEAARQMDAVSGHVGLLNDVSTYLCQQIPVQINGKSTTAELYVLNKGKRGKKIDAESANMLIALDTENLGRVEALASVSRKNLRLRFGVERPDLIGYINSYTAELGRAMQEIGFRLSDMRAQVIAKPVNPVTAEMAAQPEAAGMLDMKL